MIDIGLVALTIFAYLVAAAWQLRFAPQNRGRLSKRSALLGVIAVLSHATVLGTQVSSQTSSALSLVDASSLAFLMTNIATLALLALRPLQTLLIGLFPLSALAVLIAAIGPDTVSPLALQPGTIIHIAGSLAANALLAMSAMQAIIVSIQDRRLRAHNNSGLTQWLPPLQKMERLLFELLLIGFLLLSFSIVSGFLFLEDMLAQHVAHKTVFTISAWLIYASLLWGHHYLGWRSRSAVKLTLIGFALILLAYYGSKLVLEWIL